MQRTAVILVVGLSQSLLPHAPRISAFASANRVRRLRPPLPAVTCTAQSSMLTGRGVGSHGVVANGWYDRALADVMFWKQSNRLVIGDKVWHAARRRDAAFTCAKVFWWYNMYAEVDYAVTPRPQYKADGRKKPDVHTYPAGLRERLQSELGVFPLFKFWGPMADITSTRWIADAAMKIEEWHAPTLSLVYLPHLDYPLQKVGPGDASIPAEVRAVDDEVGRLLDLYERRGVHPVIVSEYGIEPVQTPVHINRELRRAGLLRVREEDGLELLDPGASERGEPGAGGDARGGGRGADDRGGAFAVADHQVAHVYVGRGASIEHVSHVADVCRGVAGVERVMTKEEMLASGLYHERSGDLLLVAKPGAWFTYYYWLDDARAPDFARTVDIHRKPGYDPVELFRNPSISTLGVMRRLACRKLGLRTLLNVIPLDATLVKGSHGRVEIARGLEPIVIGPVAVVGTSDEVMPSEGVHDLILRSVFE